MFKINKTWPLDIDESIIPDAYIIDRKVEEAMINNDKLIMPSLESDQEMPKSSNNNEESVIIIPF